MRRGSRRQPGRGRGRPSGTLGAGRADPARSLRRPRRRTGPRGNLSIAGRLRGCVAAGTSRRQWVAASIVAHRLLTDAPAPVTPFTRQDGATVWTPAGRVRVSVTAEVCATAVEDTSRRLARRLPGHHLD